MNDRQRRSRPIGSNILYLFVRAQKIMLEADLAELHQVETNSS